MIGLFAVLLGVSGGMHNFIVIMFSLSSCLESFVLALALEMLLFMIDSISFYFFGFFFFFMWY